MRWPFEVLYHRQQYRELAAPADYAIDHDFPDLARLQERLSPAAAGKEVKYMAGGTVAKLIRHGVMNTDTYTSPD